MHKSPLVKLAKTVKTTRLSACGLPWIIWNFSELHFVSWDPPNTPGEDSIPKAKASRNHENQGCVGSGMIFSELKLFCGEDP